MIDDDELVNTINAIHFRKMGLEDKVRSFTNPELALETLRFRNNPGQKTLILLDINMPEMSGFEFLECMVQEDFPISNEVLIVTSSDSEYDREKAIAYSRYVKGFISKPLKVEYLKPFLECLGT